MIAIVRMKAQENREMLWDSIVANSGKLQERLQEGGRLLYVSQRAKHDDASLFVHVTNPDALGSLIAEEVCKIEGLTGCWVINMLKPIFFPLPRDTRQMKRYVITARVFPTALAQVYQSLSQPNLYRGIMMAYLALTCHLYGDCIQFSVLAKEKEDLDRYMDDKVKTLPGVTHTTVCFIEKTKPLVSYDEWKEYSTRHSLVPSWNEAHMLKQFSG